MMRFALPLATLLLGLAAGWLLARPAPPQPEVPEPREWVARIGGHYIDGALFRDEMRRRGGARPGSFQGEDDRRALLDDLLYRQALANAAREAGVDRQPEVSRAIDQLLASRWIELTLREQQQQIQVSDDELRAYWREHADEYQVPARRRVAMIHVAVPEDAEPARWQAAEAVANEALAEARALAPEVVHFGAVARERSDDAGSRYRGGVIGWIAEGQAARYRFDPVVLEAAEQLEQAGQLAGPLRGGDGWYLVRLVERQTGSEREFAELRDGLRQRLLRQRLDEVAAGFRERMLDAADIEIREDLLAEIDPLSAPLDDPTPQPPALPES